MEEETTMPKPQQTYEGWSNYETWTVSLWMKSTKASFDHWRQHAARQREAAPTCEEVIQGTWTMEEAAQFRLAEQIKAEITDRFPLTTPAVHNDLPSVALGEVNWHEIAEDWLVADFPKENPVHDVFGPVISAYSRAQAIEDGVLVDVSEMGREAGIKYPIALTFAVWAEYVEVPLGVECQDEQGRLWDILQMFRVAAKQSGGCSELRFQVLVRNDNTAPKPVTLKAICGPGDTTEPVLTIMLPDED
jgi:hypothetical protein